MAFKINDDHWAFLDEIEAPMWVDLNLEANPISKQQDIDDKWFYTSHQFHHCSSSHLKSVFSHGGDENFLGPSSSPNLPCSVSKSRGKQYRSEKWKLDNQGISFDKSHPVNALTGKLGPRNKAKPNSSWTHLNETSTSKSSICEGSSSGKAVSSCSDPLSARGDHMSSLSSDSKKTSGGNPTSTVTSENSQEQLKGVDVSSQALGQTNGLLLMMKKSLRKSNITRQAMRVEIHNDAKQFIGRNSTSSKSSIFGRNSTSSKSSVGSSSNPRNDVGISSTSSLRTKEITPESRNLATSRMSSLGVVKASSMKVDEKASNNRRRGQVNILKSVQNEAAKQKVQYRDSRSKASGPFGVNKQNLTLAPTKLKKKMGIGCDGIDNVIGISSVIQKKCNGKGIASGESVEGKDQKEMKRQYLSGTICSKGKGRGRGNLEKPKNSVQRVHFR